MIDRTVTTILHPDWCHSGIHCNLRCDITNSSDIWPRAGLEEAGPVSAAGMP